MSEEFLRVENLYKSFNEHKAVNGISFTIYLICISIYNAFPLHKKEYCSQDVFQSIRCASFGHEVIIILKDFVLDGSILKLQLFDED